MNIQQAVAGATRIVGEPVRRPERSESIREAIKDLTQDAYMRGQDNIMFFLLRLAEGTSAISHLSISPAMRAFVVAVTDYYFDTEARRLMKERDRYHSKQTPEIIKIVERMER